MSHQTEMRRWWVKLEKSSLTSQHGKVDSSVAICVDWEGNWSPGRPVNTGFEMVNHCIGGVLVLDA